MVENQIRSTKPATPEESNEMNKKVDPPDGGWGWMVVFGAALTNVFNQSQLGTFGLLYGEEIEKLGHGTQGAALVLSFMLLVQNFCGPIGAFAIKLTSPRTVALVGVALSGSGCILSGCSTALWHLLMTYGFMLGLGLGLIQSGTFVSINAYFKSKRGRAVGFSVVGTGVGQMIMPHVVRYLLDKYTFANTTLVLGGLCFQGFIGCSLIQPVDWHQKRDINETNEKRQLLENQKVIIRKTSDAKISALNNKIATEPEKKPQLQELQVQETLAARIKRLLDIELLTDFRFQILIIGCAFAVVSANSFSLIFPFFLQESVFLTKQQTATCMSFIAGSDIIGRLTLPTISDHFKVPARVSFLSTALYIMVIRQILAFQSSYTTLLVTSALYGCGRSMIIVTNNIAVTENYPQERVAAALGLGMLVKGVLVMPLNLFLGWVRDFTGSFILCMTAQNALIVLLAAMWIPDMIYLRYIKRKQNDQNIDL